MIDDQEMRELFRIESEEHLQRIETGLLRLEQAPDDADALAEVFRETHSMKGAARMLGLREIESLAHAMEEIFARVSRSGTPLDPPLLDSLCKALDGLRRMAAAVLSGIPDNVPLAALLGLLKAPRPMSEREAPVPTPPVPVREPEMAATSPDEPAAPPADGEARPVFPRDADSGVLETLRVETRKLDRLLNRSGELSVASLRLSGRLAELDDLLDCLPAGAPGISRQERERFGELKRLLAADSAHLGSIGTELAEGIRELRMLPLTTILQRFPRMARDLARDRGRRCELLIEGGETAVDKKILEELKDPLVHLLRNAVDHGIEPPELRRRQGKPEQGTIRLRASQAAGRVLIELADDGQGLDFEDIRQVAAKGPGWRPGELEGLSADGLQELIFTPGFSTSRFVSDVSGRGIGLDVVRTKVEGLKGTVGVHSRPGAGTTFQIRLPASLVTVRVVVVTSAGMRFALPLEHLTRALLLRRGDFISLEGRSALLVDGAPVVVARLADLLPLQRSDFAVAVPAAAAAPEELLPCLLLTVRGERFVLLVDDLGEEQEIMVRENGDFLDRVPGVAGTTLLGGGEVCPVLEPADFIATLGRRATVALAAEAEVATKKRVLLAEDSLTTRTRMKRILEGGGYEVETAVDGVDALARLGTARFDALVSDISMPNMDGLTLTTRVRQLKRYAELPVVLVTMLASEEDRRRGLDAGANAYITKSAFDQKLLLDTLRRLL